MEREDMSRNAPEFRAFQRTVATLWAGSALARAVTFPGPEAAVKLAEETGEVAKEVGLLGHAWVTPENQAGRDRLLGEIGDCMFVLARIANIYGLDLGQAGRLSLEKFAARYSGTVCTCDQANQPLRRYRPCPGGLRGCYFMNDEVVPVGATCGRCGAKKEGGW